MAKLNPVLKNAKKRFEESSGVVGFDFTILLQLLPAFISLFQSCKKQPEPNPNPNPTPAEAKAYNMHWYATTGWVGGKDHYKAGLLNSTIKEIRKKNKKDGSKISKDEARKLAVAALDEARLNDVPTLAAAIEQSEG